MHWGREGRQVLYAAPFGTEVSSISRIAREVNVGAHVVDPPPGYRSQSRTVQARQSGRLRRSLLRIPRADPHLLITHLQAIGSTARLRIVLEAGLPASRWYNRGLGHRIRRLCRRLPSQTIELHGRESWSRSPTGPRLPRYELAVGAIPRTHRKCYQQTIYS